MTRTVLIVDDDAEVTRTFGESLRAEGYEVRTAADGEDARRQLIGVDAIILDLRMPMVDGLEFLRSVRKANNDVPIALVTGDYLIDDAVVSEVERLDAKVLFKPLWIDELVDVTAAMVAQGAQP
jgi:two-component system OmpR family response regulator